MNLINSFISAENADEVERLAKIYQGAASHLTDFSRMATAETVRLVVGVLKCGI